MIIRPYTYRDYDQVKHLIIKTGYTWIPAMDELGGYGLVAEEGDLIHGFVWALTSTDSCIAFVEYFAISPAKREGGIAAGMLMGRLLSYLHSRGKKLITGVIKKYTDHGNAITRLYHAAGMEVDEGLLVIGHVDKVHGNIKSMVNRKINGG
jgi:hypothetical protein